MSKHSKAKKKQRKTQNAHQNKSPNLTHIIQIKEIVPKLFEFFGKGILIWIPKLPPIYTTTPEPNSSDEVLLNTYDPLSEFIFSTPIVDPASPKNQAEVLLSTLFITGIDKLNSEKGNLRIVSYAPKHEFLSKSNLSQFLHNT